MTNYAPTAFGDDGPVSPYAPPLAGDDWQAASPMRGWQITPPVVTGGRIPVVNGQPQETPPNGMNFPQGAQPALGADGAPVMRVSFAGANQQWYSINVGQSPLAQSQPLPMQARTVQSQPLPMQGQGIEAQLQAIQAQLTQTQAMQAQLMQAQAMQAQPALHPAWNMPVTPNAGMLVGPNNPAATRSQPEEAPAEDASRDFVLQIVQPSLVGLMDGSVSTLAPIFSVAFATHNPFTTFIIGLASALGAGISMAFSEALSDDGELTGRGKPFLRGGVTGLMTFLSGLGHALPFLLPNIHLALTTAYVVVAVELVVIAAIRHKFFGTSWWLSIVQVVGGGALVFAVAFLLGNA